MQTLLAAGADVDIGGTTGRTALHVASGRAYHQTVVALLAAGACKDALDDDGDTPLIWAAEGGYLTVVKTLLTARADPTIIPSVTGETALIVAITKEDIHVAKALLDHGVDVNTRNDKHEHKFTPLHWACHREVGNVMLNLLLWSGADETVEDGDGKTPAQKTKCDRVRQLLSKTPVDIMWSRRGWLLMLRSRRQRSWAAEAETHSMKRRRGVVAAVSSIVGTAVLQARAGIVWAAGGHGGDAKLESVVEGLLALELDGVLRNVVSLL